MAQQRLLVLLVLVLFTVTACSKDLSITFEIPKEELQKKIEEKFPMTPPKEKAPFEMTISNPTVILEEGKDKIGLQVNIVAELAEPAGKPPLPEPKASAPIAKPEGKRLPLPDPGSRPGPKPKILADKPDVKPPIAEKLPPPPAKPRFTGSATIFVSINYDPKIKSLRLSDPKIVKLDIAQLPDALNQPISQMAEKALTEKLAEKPIPLENKTELEKAASSFLKSITVKNGKLLVTLGL